jgi:hypothetical protein
MAGLPIGSLKIGSAIEAAAPTAEDGKPRPDFIDWDEYFMAVSFLSAQRSKDPATQVILLLLLIALALMSAPHGLLCQFCLARQAMYHRVSRVLSFVPGGGGWGISADVIRGKKK